MTAPMLMHSMYQISQWKPNQWFYPCKFGQFLFCFLKGTREFVRAIKQTYHVHQATTEIAGLCHNWHGLIVPHSTKQFILTSPTIPARSASTCSQHYTMISSYTYTALSRFSCPCCCERALNGNFLHGTIPHSLGSANELTNLYV